MDFMEIFLIVVIAIFTLGALLSGISAAKPRERARKDDPSIFKDVDPDDSSMDP